MLNLKKIDVMSLHSNMLHKKNLAPATANKFLVFLNSAYNLANEFELLDDYNPCRGVKEYELNNQRQLFLSKGFSSCVFYFNHKACEFTIEVLNFCFIGWWF